MERPDLPPSTDPIAGSKDGSGAGDNDQPYTFGRRPRAIAPWPFTDRQFALLLLLRGRLADQPDVDDGCQPLPQALPPLPQQPPTA